MSYLILKSPLRIIVPILWMWKLRSRGSAACDHTCERAELRVRPRSSLIPESPLCVPSLSSLLFPAPPLGSKLLNQPQEGVAVGDQAEPGTPARPATQAWSWW